MSSISKATHVITLPARTAIGIASAGVRTTVRLLSWAAGQASGPVPVRSTDVPPVRVPRPVRPVADPMTPTRTAPVAVPTQKAPARKVPAGQVPLKSAPTPSMPAALESYDDLDDVPPTVPVKKAAAKTTAAKTTAAKTTAAKKAPAKKAPSKQAAVLAPALGLSEAEVAEAGGSDAGKA